MLSAEFGIAVAANLIAALAGDYIKHLLGTRSNRSNLEDLSNTVSHVKNVLIDAQKNQDLNEAEQGYVQRLINAVYEADDLFEELVTDAELNQHKGSNALVKVTKNMTQANPISRKIQTIKKLFDDIATNHRNFTLRSGYNSFRRDSVETCSVLDENLIVGREQKRDLVVNMLLERDICFLPIVGVGGVGKTDLAKLVYHDNRIKEVFGVNQLWVWVSDQYKQFDEKTILCHILEQVTEKPNISSLKENVVKQFQNLKGKKYFLVLDDVWNEDRGKWLQLKAVLQIMVKEGSKILVTTRSRITANIINGTHCCELDGLSQEDSLRMFQKYAIYNELEEQQIYDDTMVENGLKISEMCYGNPYAIQQVSNILFDKQTTEWLSFLRDNTLAEIGEANENVLSSFMLSYHNLESSLKRCFSYCAIFKDSMIEKEMLIGLWMAQGYIAMLNGTRNLEEAASEHLSLLLKRCFVQNVVDGDVEFVKLDELMHDVARVIGKQEISILTSLQTTMGDNIRHVRYADDGCPNNFICRENFRSYFCKKYNEARIENWKRLRVLDLSSSEFENLTDTINSLRLLRYLNLSSNRNLKKLTESVTRLYNLQTLILRDCTNLMELPNDFSKLIKLRRLDLRGCDQLDGSFLGIDEQIVRRSSRAGQRNFTQHIVENKNSSVIAKLNFLWKARKRHDRGT